MIIAYDLPHFGDVTLVRGEDLRIFIGGGIVGVGFLNEVLPDDPDVVTPADIGQLAVVHYVENVPENVQ